MVRVACGGSHHAHGHRGRGCLSGVVSVERALPPLLLIAASRSLLAAVALPTALVGGARARQLQFTGRPHSNSMLRRASSLRESLLQQQEQTQKDMDATKDDPLIRLLRLAPRSAAERQLARELFEEQGPEDGTLNYRQVLQLLLRLWRGQLFMPPQGLEDAQNDALSLLHSLDLDKDGRCSLDEFIDFFAAIAEAAEEGMGTPSSQSVDGVLFQNWVGDTVSGTRLSVRDCIGLLGRVAVGLSDSMDMLSQDIRYNTRLVLRLLDGEHMEDIEISMLKRAASDLVTYIPHVTVAMWPLPLAGHAFVFAIVKTCAPHLCPSPFGGSRLRLSSALRSVRQHPEYQAWSLFGEGPSEEVDDAVASIFETAPNSSLFRKSRISDLFTKLDGNSTGSVGHKQVLGIVQAIWNGKLNLPKQRMEDFRMDATALMLALDRKDTGLMTLGQFSEFLETLADVAASYAKEEPLDANFSNLLIDGREDEKEVVSSFICVARRSLASFADSLSILARDARYASSLALRSVRGRTLSSMDAAILNRAGKDAASVVPYAAIGFASVTLFLKILAVALIWKNAPSLFPSSFSKHRRRLASAWRAIAAKQRERVYNDWLAFEQKRNVELDVPASALSMPSWIHKFFKQHDTDGSGTLTYGRVLGLIRAAWGGDACGTQGRGGFILMDALALIVQMDRDADGAVTLPEFVELFETLCKCAPLPGETLDRTPIYGSRSAHGSGQADIAEVTTSRRVGRWLRHRFTVAKEAVKKEVRELVDSTTMFGNDLGFAASLAARGRSALSATERSMLRRAAKDLVLFVPIGAIIVAPLTPIGTALTISLLKRTFPMIVPSSFGEPRLQLVRALRATRQQAQRRALPAPRAELQP